MGAVKRIFCRVTGRSLAILVWIILARTSSAQTFQRFLLPPTGTRFLKGLTVGPDGNFWYAREAGPQNVGRFTPAGGLTEFILPGLNTAEDLATGPDGNLWVASGFGSQIARVTTAGLLTGLFSTPTPNSAPLDIVSGPGGSLWFTENLGNQIGKIGTGGAILEFSILGMFSPIHITAGPDGNLWFTTNVSVNRMTPAGVVTSFSVPSDVLPFDIASGLDGNLWFTFRNSLRGIGRITPAGTITFFPVGPGPSRPNRITTGSDGNLWFSDLNGGISRITTDGIITGFPTPVEWGVTEGIVSGPDGAIWFLGSSGSDGFDSVIRFSVPAAAVNVPTLSGAVTVLFAFLLAAASLLTLLRRE
jgi:virginiamycin B lyase